jgi:limonene-1,2-epoxide hydrolase
MTPNQSVIHRFYTAFRQKDYKTMQDGYAENARFRDPVFLNLNSYEVRAMWQLLMERGTDLQLTFGAISEQGKNVSATWIATYTFSLTGRKIINTIVATMEIENEKIILHHDRFDFYKWARQAFGWKGVLLGWTGFFKKKVQLNARKNLKQYMEKL